MGIKFDPKPNPQTFTTSTNQGTFITASVGDFSYAIDFYYWIPTNRTHVLVGKYCSLARQLTFNIGRNHDFQRVLTYPLGMIDKTKKLPAPKYKVRNPLQIIIGNDVWIGQAVTIMGGVKIGNGAVIGANAVVAKDIPPYTIAVGNPARVVKYRFDKETIKKMLAVKWWNWSLEKIADNFPLMNDPEKFLEAHYSPELEKFPEDDFSRKLERYGGGGIYNFIPDFRAQNSLWSNVIQDFKKAKLENAVLVTWLDKDSTDEDAKALATAIGDDKNILIFKHEENFSPTALRQGTHFITTREMITLEALDYLWNTDVKVISALDNGIFNTTLKPKENSSSAPRQDMNIITPQDMLNLENLDYLWKTNF